MAKKLVIVESPAKAKTIEKFLGGDFSVKSSYGHIRDLEKGSKGIDIGNRFEPSYVVSDAKRKVVKELKDAAKKASEVWLATDEDREGEAISWHLCEVLGLDPITTKRIVFREITKSAIDKAVAAPRTVDLDLVYAQQARRILDRLVGFELSEVLWRKVKNKLSAGRVQSVAVKLIVDKEREIQAFDSTPYFKVNADFNVSSKGGKLVKLKSELSKRLDEYTEAETFINDCKPASYTINDIVVKPLKRSSAAPFTTSTLQQEASRKLGFSVNRTMSAAQKLYEQGSITYMRTDSTSLSAQAMGDIETEIVGAFGKEYSQPRNYKSKSANAQEAHEAIRPTYINNQTVGGESDMVKLYSLIWKRAIASQMSDAKIEKTVVTIGISTRANDNLIAEGEVIKFDGFLKVYIESNDDDDSEDNEVKGMLPPLSKGQNLPLDVMIAAEKYTRAPARYTEASLVKKLEELGIGRPSTYAPTISKIMEPDRGYVTKESRPGNEIKSRVITLKLGAIKAETVDEIFGSTSNRLYGSDIGMIVVDFLGEHFGNIMDYQFTANIEKKLDDVADGGEDWKTMLETFYHPFHKGVEETLENADRAKGKRELGIDPVSGHTLLVQITRFGPVVQLGSREEVGEDEKPKFASLQPGQSMETITYEEAMELFKLPKDLGTYKGKPVSVGLGRFGPYVKYGEAFISLGRAADPMAVTLADAEVLILAKEKEDAPITTFKGEPVTQGKGRFGPFLKYKDLFINIPRRIEPEEITQEQVFELIEAKLTKEANRYIQQWEKEQIAIENGRWGPFIRFKKKSIKLPKVNDEKPTDEYLKTVPLETVIDWIEAEMPGAIKKKKK